MKTRSGYAWIAGMALILPVAALHADNSFEESQETAFVDNGEVSVELSAGDHTITVSEDNHIRISWRVETEDIGEVESETAVEGSTARIDIDGPRKNFRTVIEVPRHSDLVVRLTAGDLNIGPVEGNKDIKLRAGDLSIEVGDTGDYASIEGSLWAGDIDAGPLQMEESGLFRSIEWRGEGEHSLRFKLFAGDVTLHQSRD